MVPDAREQRYPVQCGQREFPHVSGYSHLHSDGGGCDQEARITDPSFVPHLCYTVRAMKRSLREIAESLQARLIGDGTIEVAGVSSLESAARDHLVFVDNEKHLAGALKSRAGAIIAGEFAAAVNADRPLLISDHPKLAFARAAHMLADDGRQQGAIHAGAVIDPSAMLGAGVRVEARAG